LGVVPGSASDRSTIGVATGLDPDEGIDGRVSRVTAGPLAEAGSDDIAPITLLDLAGGLLSAAALVNDVVGVRPALFGERGGYGLDVALLVAVGVGGSVCGAVKIIN